MPGLGPSWRLWAAETLEIPKLLASPPPSADPSKDPSELDAVTGRFLALASQFRVF